MPRNTTEKALKEEVAALKRKLAHSERDYDEVVCSNMMIVFWLKDKNIEVPSTTELHKMYCFDHHREMQSCPT